MTAAAAACLRILVVDDDVDTVETAALLFGLDGHEVVTARDGATGINNVIFRRPDVALIDLGMPKVDGYEVARRIQTLSITPKPYLVAVTGFGQQVDRRRCAEVGFDLHLLKPVLPNVFQGLAELLLLSKGLRVRSAEVTQQNRLETTNLMLLQLEMANLFLDAADASRVQESKDRLVAKANRAQGRVSIWLDGGTCDERRAEVVQALGELRARLYP